MIKNITLSSPSVKKCKKISDIYLIKKIGNGSYGKVYIGYNLKENANFAVKKINVEELSKTFGGINQLDREIMMLRTFDHPNMIKLIDVYKTADNLHAYIVMEYAECGSIDCIPNLTFDDVLSIMKQVSNALIQMHKKGVVHHDIKPGNILLNKAGLALLGDFGIGHRFQSAATVVGSPAYQAPEILDDDEEDSADVLNASKGDVWALGITFYELLFRKLPYSGDNLFEIINAINTVDLTIPEGTDPRVSDLLHRMLERDPQKRCSMIDIIESELIKSAADRVEIKETYEVSTLPEDAVIEEVKCSKLDPTDTFDRVFQYRQRRIPRPNYQLSPLVGPSNLVPDSFIEENDVQTPLHA